MVKKYLKELLAPLKFSAALLSFVFFNVFISSLLFICKVQVSLLQPVLATLFTICFTFFLFHNSAKKVKIISILLTLSIILVSIGLSTFMYDSSYDSIAYHKPAIGALKNGWNPVYEDVSEFNRSPNNPVKLINTNYERWVNHYGKAAWTYAANIYKVTGNIESGKSINILIALSLFLAAFYYLRALVSRNNALVLSLLLLFNPIFTTQMFSYYNDGLSGNLLLILIILLSMLVNRQKLDDSKLKYLMIIMVLPLLINIKFTYLLYAGITCAVYLAFMLLTPKLRKSAPRLIIAGLVSLVIGLGIIGLPTYPKNQIQHGNPFYPLAGEGKVDIITGQQPKGFATLNRFQKFYLANFSKTQNVTAGDPNMPDLPELKLPFTVYKSEINYLNYTDSRIGGYGVLFGGILLVSSIIILLTLIRLSAMKDWQKVLRICLPIIPLVLTFIIFADVWWARYFPQLYILPIIAAIILIRKDSPNLSHVLIFLLLANITFTATICFSSEMDAIAWKGTEDSQIRVITQNGKYTPKLYLGEFGGYGYSIYDRYKKINIIDSIPNNTADSGNADSASISYGIYVTR